MAGFTIGSVTDCLIHSAVTHPSQVNGDEVTVTGGAIAAYIWLYHGATEAAANTNPGYFMILTKPEAAGTDEGYAEVTRLTTQPGTSTFATINATEAIDQTDLTTVAGEGANLTNGELVYITDATATADGEWHILLDGTNGGSATQMLIDEGLIKAKASADEITDLASAFMFVLPLAGVVEWKVIFSHHGATGANCDVFGRYIEVTGFA